MDYEVFVDLIGLLDAWFGTYFVRFSLGWIGWLRACLIISRLNSAVTSYGLQNYTEGPTLFVFLFAFQRFNFFQNLHGSAMSYCPSFYIVLEENKAIQFSELRRSFLFNTP